MVKVERPVVKPASVRVAFDDERAVANAGLVLPAALAERLGIERLVNEKTRSYPCVAQRHAN